MQCTCTLLVVGSSSKKQIPCLARARTAGAPQGLPAELHFPLGAHGTELQWLSARPMSQWHADLKCGWPTCHSHGVGVVRDSLVRDEPAGGGMAVARVPQLGIGALRGVDGHIGGYYL